MDTLINILTLSYLFLFSLYHVITGVVSVFFTDFSLKFYKALYGFQPKETEQLKMTFKPWGNFAIITGIIGFMVFYNIEKFSLILFPFALLLLIRIWYRFTLRKQLSNVLKINKFQNWRMIFIQLIGSILFTLFALSSLGL